MKAPSISVVMAVYNNMPFLQLAVESILRQTYRDFEFIIIDDGSTDGGGEVLEEMAHRDSRIQLKRRENRGLTKSLNEGCALARGEFIARMDGDDVSYANRFELQIQEMTRKPEIVALGAQVRYVNESNSPLFIRHVPLVHEDIEKCHLSTWGGVVIHPVAIFRRKAFEAVGGYDEFFECAQDYDLWFRIGRVGVLANMPNLLLDYRRHNRAVGSKSKDKQANAVKIIRERELLQRGMTMPLQMPEKYIVYPNDIKWIANESAKSGFIKTTFLANIKLSLYHVKSLLKCFLNLIKIPVIFVFRNKFNVI
jgi:glycosyltransferase involved in cell wall biosynthesis